MRAAVRLAYPPFVEAMTSGDRPGADPVPPRACVVDDDPGVRQWLTQVLESRGIEVCGVAGTIDEGLASIAAQRPDLAVVDSRLPDGRGVDLCREVSATRPEMTLILHTGMIGPEEVSRAYQAGVTRIALKSIQGEELLAAVEDFSVRYRGARA